MRVVKNTRNKSFLKLSCACLGLTAGYLSVGMTQANAQSFEDRCVALNNYNIIVPAGEEIDLVEMQSAEVVAASGNTPKHCAVTFKVDVDVTDPKDWFVTSTYFLPEGNPTRFIHTGGGGSSSGWNGRADSTLLREGIPHAEMNNDSLQNGLLWVDADLDDEADSAFSRDGMHLSTVVGKQILEEFYAGGPEYSYYVGCSTGGNQGLQAALYHPDTFDGIVAGAPVFYAAEIAHWALWQKQLKEGLLTNSSKTSQLAAAVIEECDTLDGVEDGIVDRPEQCRPHIFKMAEQAGFTHAETRILREFLRDDVIVGKSEFQKGTAKVQVPAWNVLHPSIGSAGVANLFSPAFWGALDTSYAPEDNGNRSVWQQAFLAYPFGSKQYRDQIASYDTSPLGGQYDRSVEVVGEAGAKLLVWHTWRDSIANIEHTLDWVDFQDRKVRKEQSHDYFRFLAKTTGGHCSANGEVLRQAIFGWVEQDKDFDSLLLDAGSNRPACSYPEVPKLVNAGTDEWACVKAKVEK